MSRPLISLGDALRACHHLEPKDGDTAEAILELLGLAAERTVQAPANIGAWKPSSTDHVSRVQRRVSERRGVPKALDARTTRLPTPATEGRGRTTVVSRIGEDGTGFRRPDWVDHGPALHEMAPPGEGPGAPDLFGRVTRRGILTSAIATEVLEGDLDIDAIVATLASGSAVRRLPRLGVHTTRRGVQVLVDRCQGMTPFREDQRVVEKVLDDLLADDRLEVLHFEGCPSRGILNRGRRTERRSSRVRAWKPPPPGTPIVAITDVGIGGPMIDEARATPDEWARFADRARRAGFRLAGLVPYEASRWPPRVARAMTLLHWSERTTAGEVRRAMRDAVQRLR